MIWFCYFVKVWKLSFNPSGLHLCHRLKTPMEDLLLAHFQINVSLKKHHPFKHLSLINHLLFFEYFLPAIAQTLQNLVLCFIYFNHIYVNPGYNIICFI